MKFDDYKKLARLVFPELPAAFEEMPDEMKTYQLVFNYTCPYDTSKFKDLDFFGRVNLFSVSHCTTLQMRHILQFGRTYWE